MQRSIFTVGAVIALAFFFVACGPTNSHFKEVRDAVFDDNQKLNTSIEMSLGLIPIRMAGAVASFIQEPEAQEGCEYIKHVSRVDVGVYQFQHSLENQFPEVSQRVRACMLENGFEPVVRVREARECVGVYIPNNQDRLAREFFVVVMEKKQVVIVRVRGNFEKIARAVYRNHARELPSFQTLFHNEIVL